MTTTALPNGPTRAVANAPSGDEPFSRFTGWLLTLGIGGSLLLSLLLLVFRTEAVTEISVGSDSYSSSALGHQLFENLLRETGRPLTRSRFQTAARSRRNLLILAEPRDDTTELRELIASAKRVLVVLPKRRGERDPNAEHWVRTTRLRDPAEANRILQSLAPNASVLRLDEPVTSWQHDGELPELPTPTLADVQVLRGSGYRPLLRTRFGALLAEVETQDGTVHVLSDPDVLANHGIDDGDNAAFVLGLVDALREGHGIVLDETLHGFELPPSLWEQLGRFPLVLVLVHALLLLALLSWIAIGRFGPQVAARPALDQDKRFLLDNTASLLVRGKQTSAALQRYFRERVRHCARHLGVKSGDDAQLLAVVAAAASRRATDRFGALRKELAATGQGESTLPSKRVVELARRIHAECEEIVHGKH